MRRPRSPRARSAVPDLGSLLNRIIGATLSLVTMGTPVAARPNILLAVADDMSHASAYGYHFLETPHFDSLAEEGLRFTRMHTPSSKCAPSRASMITGRNPWQLEEAANHRPIWPEKFKSVVEALADHGYFTGFTGKGWNPGVHPKNRELTGTEYNRVKMVDPPTENLASYDYSANFKQFLDDKPEDQPFFFWYGCKEPHRGYEFKSGVKAGKSLDDLDFLPAFWHASESTKHDILDYAVEVEYYDQHLGRILETLELAGELGNTLIIATSDNSMPFPRFKGHPHAFATRLPFVVKWPGRIKAPGRVCPEFASIIDLAPTFLEAAGIPEEASGMQPIQGRSLFDFFNNSVSGRTTLLTGRERNDMCRPNGWGYPVRSLLRGDHVYMHNFEPDRWPCGTEESGFRDSDWGPTKSELVHNQKGTDAHAYCFGKRPLEEFYDLATDPECLHNLARNPEYAERMASMKSLLFAELTLQADPRMLGDGTVFDEYGSQRHKEYDKLVNTVKRGRSKKKSQ